MCSEASGKGIMTYLVPEIQSRPRRRSLRIGVDSFLGKALPKDKVEVIKRLQERGEGRMVGDGSRCSSLAKPMWGLRSSGGDISKDHADVILMGDTPVRILDVIELSSLTMQTVRQNVFFAFFYNALGIPLAMAGLLNPLVAVFAMFAAAFP